MPKCPECRKSFRVFEDEDDGQHGCPSCGCGDRDRDEPSTNEPDYRFENHGSIWLCQPLTDIAHVHLSEHTDGQWLGGALAVEPRYVSQLAEQLEADGFSTEI